MKTNSMRNPNIAQADNANFTASSGNHFSIIYQGSLLTKSTKREISRITQKVKNSLSNQMSG